MNSEFSGLGWIDLSLVSAYLILLIVLSWRSRKELRASSKEEHYLLSGRRLSLPAFVATLVSTWYGGILGVGEFSYLFGISQWIVMGLPYYLFAVLFAVFFAGKIRENAALSIPEAVGNTYGGRSSRISAGLIFLLVNPAPYILMVAMIAKFMLGIDGFYVTVGVAVFSAFYVAWGGFGAVVRTDIFQVVLMYSGFAMLLAFAWVQFGSPATLLPQLPDTHLEPTGGQSPSYLLVWFFIALWTFVDPGFHQRAAAAKSPKTARNGIFVAILCWFIFDMATLLTALYGVAMLSELSNAVLVYPALAQQLLPTGLLGLFILTLLATVMSTLDSFLFLAGQTLGRDFMAPTSVSKTTHTSIASANNTGTLNTADTTYIAEPAAEVVNDTYALNTANATAAYGTTDVSGAFSGEQIIRRTQWGIGIAAITGVLLAWLFPSVIELWYVIGSVVIPGLLIPVVGVYYPFFRVQGRFAVQLLVLPPAVALLWLIGGVLSGDPFSYAMFGIEPFYPGLATSALLFGGLKFFNRA